MKIINSPSLYFLSGNIIMIGVGSLIMNDVNSFLLLIIACVCFLVGFMAASKSFRIISYRHNAQEIITTKELDKYKKSVYIVVFLLIVCLLFIHYRYGLPFLSEDMTISRLKQRHYIEILTFIQYTTPVAIVLSYVIYEQKKSPVLFIMVLLLSAIVSTLLAVRYLFAESILFFLIFIIVKDDKKLLKIILKISKYIIVFILFFAFVQFKRTSSGGDLSLYEVLINRFFIVNYEIFELSFLTWDLSNFTYFNSFSKVLGNESYNIGFLLYDALGHTQRVQGYAPPSLVGEAYINFENIYVSLIALFIIGFIYAIIASALLYGVPKNSKRIFIAFLYLEMFRLYAHTLIGSIFALVIFTIFLLLLTKRVRISD